MGDLFAFDSSTYETDVYGRLEESFHEYLDDKEYIDKLVPHIEKILTKELKERKNGYEQVDSIFKTLFPVKEAEVKKPVILG